MNKETRSQNMMALRDIVMAHSSPSELAGDAASILSKLDTKFIRSVLDRGKLINPEKGSREEYCTRALKKIVELAEEFQKEFSETAHEKFGQKGGPGLN